MSLKIAFIGMGEAGNAFVMGWGEKLSSSIIAYDIKSDCAETAEAMDTCYAEIGIRGAASHAEAAADADLIFCTVTADQAITAAEQAAAHLERDAFWCDLNSCAPSSKRQAAEIIEGANGRYIDVAMMAPVHPMRNMTPLLMSGPHAEAALPILKDLPTAPRVVAGGVDAASSIKMIRSIMVKGLEALTAECALAAVAADVKDEVFGSLRQSHSGIDWPAFAEYNIERSMVHGLRRAAEMEEVAKTLTDLGLPNDMARSTTEWQRRTGKVGSEVTEISKSADFEIMAKLLLSRLHD